MNNNIDSGNYDEEIEELKVEMHYYDLLEKWGKDNVDFYKSEDVIGRLKYAGVKDKKYSNDEYLRKISAIAYPKYIYDNFQKIANGKYKNCEMLHLPIFNLNGLSTVTRKNNPIIILDFFLSNTLFLICYSFVTYLFVVAKEFLYDKEFQSKTDVFMKTIMPTGLSFMKFFIRKSPEDLAQGFGAVKMFSKENWRIINNAALLSRAIILFIICHEQAHHELGHTSYTKNLLENSEIFSESEVEESQNMEYAADRVALSMFMECIRPESDFGLFNSLDSFYLAPFYFFEILHSIEGLTINEKQKVTHPSAKRRYLNILKALDYNKYKRDVPIEDIEKWDDYFQTIMSIIHSTHG